MRKYRDRRKKAFIGAAISAATSIANMFIGNAKAKKQAEAQAKAARIQAENQQAAIDQQMANQQAQIDANYEQQLAQVKAQEELNKEQNQLAAQKIGIQDAQSLTQAYGNQAELNNEFKNRFAKFGGKFKCGGRKKAETGTSYNYKPKTAQSDFLDNWNKARLATGKFNDQLGDGKMEQQAESRNTAPVYESLNAFSKSSAMKEFVNRYGNNPTNIINNMDAINNRGKFIYNYIGNKGGAYYAPAHTVYLNSEGLLFKPTTKEHEFAHASKAKEQEAKIAEITGFNGNSSYLDLPTEIYSRLTELRKHYNINPNKTWNIDEIKEMRKNVSKGSKGFNILNNYDDNTVLRLFNEVAQNNNNKFDKFNDYNKTYKARYGGRKKAEEGTKFGLGDAFNAMSNIGGVIANATAPVSSTPAFKLDYSQRLEYHDPVVADLEVDKSIAKSYTSKQAGQNTAQYAGVNAINNNTTANTMQQRFKNGGKIIYRNRYKRLK